MRSGPYWGGGAPDTLADMIAAWVQEAGCGRMNVAFEHADMPEWMVRKSTILFANEVIPRVRARLADQARETTARLPRSAERRNGYGLSRRLIGPIRSSL